MKRHTYPEAARELRVEETWLRRHIKRLPHSKKGRVVTFSDDDLTAIDAMFHHEPAAFGALAASVPPAASRAAHPLAQLRPLPSRRAS